MPDEIYGDIGDDLIRFHKLITRSLNVAIQNVNRFLDEKTLSQSDGEGFIKYMQSFSSVLDAHHLLENKKIFPYFIDKLPDAFYDRLILQHKTVKVLLKGIDDGIGNLKSNLNDLDSLNLLRSNLVRIDLMWHPHIEIEESQIFGKVRILNISLEEMSRLRNEFSQFFEEHTGPVYLIIPFILYNLSTEDRVIISQQFPEIVTKQLVPIDWKDEWSSMKPFLLE